MNSDIPWSTIIVASVALSLVLPSCGKSSQTTDRASEEQILQQAKQCDIPVPVGFKPVAIKNQPAEQNKTILHYQGNLSIKKITRFYQQSMELHGWNIQDFSTPQEGLLFCNKAHKSCAISMTKDTIKIVLCKTPASPSIQYYAAHKQNTRDIDIINKKEINLS